MMLRKGFDFEDARDYALMGCVEPQKSGRGFNSGSPVTPSGQSCSNLF